MTKQYDDAVGVFDDSVGVFDGGTTLTVNDSTHALSSDVIVLSVSVSGSTTWGRDTSSETNTRDFSGNWSGTGTISGSGNAEQMRIDPGESMESEIINIGSNTIGIDIDKYDTGVGPAPIVEYKDGNSESNCNADTWNAYSTSFLSTGYVKIRIRVAA